jgi:hypothetical protein
MKLMYYCHPHEGGNSSLRYDDGDDSFFVIVIEIAHDEQRK